MFHRSVSKSSPSPSLPFPSLRPSPKKISSTSYLNIFYVLLIIPPLYYIISTFHKSPSSLRSLPKHHTQKHWKHGDHETNIHPKSPSISLPPKTPLKYDSSLKINPSHIPLVHPESCQNDYLTHIRQRLHASPGGKSPWFSTSWRKKTGYWQQSVNDKYGSTLFAQSLGVKAPRVLWCGDYNDLEGAIEDVERSGFNKGYVIKPKKGHSSKGVNVFPDGIKSTGLFKETLRDSYTSLKDLLNEYSKLVSTEGSNYEELYIEEIVCRKPGEIIDYKFLMFGEEIGAITVFANRGTEGFCKSFFDKDWNRVDEGGCFGAERSVEHKYGKTPICSVVERPPFYLELEKAAKVLGKGLGVYMRIDFMVDYVNGEVYLGEVSPWPDGGSSHCYSVGGDSCHLSRMWKGLEGGPGSVKPGWVEEFEEEEDKCKFVMEFNEKMKKGGE